MPSEAGAARRTIQANVIRWQLLAANSRTCFNIGINYNLAQLMGWCLRPSCPHRYWRMASNRK